MAERVRITDVAPRDGLQSEPGIIPSADKVRLVELLAATGVDEIEVSSFVAPRWMPQLADAREVFAQLSGRKPRGMCFSALVPNQRGLEAALETNVAAGTRLIDKVAVFTAASETFAQRNTNATIAQTLDRFEPVVKAAAGAGLLLRGYVSCAVACPFEGPTPPQRAADVAARLYAMGVGEIDLADTIGVGTPADVSALLEAVLRSGCGLGLGQLTLHLHDTFGRAAACVREALRAGVRSFDGAAGGLGGCPYASTDGARAPGNVATELLVATVHAVGYETGVRVDALRLAAEFARGLCGRS
jgi:hydroxymethylglutaryl-CoA lyase